MQSPRAPASEPTATSAYCRGYSPQAAAIKENNPHAAQQVPGTKFLKKKPHQGSLTGLWGHAPGTGPIHSLNPMQRDMAATSLGCPRICVGDNTVLGATSPYWTFICETHQVEDESDCGIIKFVDHQSRRDHLRHSGAAPVKRFFALLIERIDALRFATVIRRSPREPGVKGYASVGRRQKTRSAHRAYRCSSAQPPLMVFRLAGPALWTRFVGRRGHWAVRR